ncbi:MAG: hypothetical protein ABW275_03485 [Hansschlegelia sp.]
MRMLSAVAICALLVAAGASGVRAQVAPQRQPDLIYTPVTPCRAFDTRATTPVAANTTRSFHISGSHDFPGQGGPEHGCGVPTYATSVSMSLTAVNEADAGYLTAFPYKAARPIVTSLYYQRNVTLANSVISAISEGNLSLYSSRQTHVVGDVTGYYSPQIQAHITYNGEIASGTPRVVAVTHADVGSYFVDIDRPARECAPSAITYNLGHYASVGLSSSGTPNRLSVYTWNINSTGGTVLADEDFFFTVTC